ncbi:MAG: carbohydrate binding family 9 domain-containing protein [Ignavibacteriales bacterium]|nr:carbohydrate binding family 9 domain-containing protein [Ignavibacteriales bacterium]
MHKYFVTISAIVFATGIIMAGDNSVTIRAVRVTSPPRVDGLLKDEVWKLASPADHFMQRDPEEGKPASERTEIRVVYDDEALYFGCMYYDTEPEKIVSRLTRRDNEIESDWGSIRIDSYNDHQTCFEFTFNPSGVKADIIQYDDGEREDESWDPVWDVETSIQPNGWVAEVKIPFRILRYKSSSVETSENIWGINFLRTISRKQESDRWAFTPKRESGFISRFGHLAGIEHLPDPKPIEVLPFVTGKQIYDPATSVRDRQQKFFGNAGVDLKYGISSNFTLDATVNPDFGQVEADPAVLNLSTFETFYPEKRPFFIEGTQILHFTTFGGDFGPGMFYSRRIGRALSMESIEVPDGGRIVDFPQNVTILGAAKLTGKTSDGLSVGMMQAFTQKENAIVADSSGMTSEQLLEPFAHYNVIRLKQDILGHSNIGMMVTSVTKKNRAPAFTNGYDWNLKFGENAYKLTGFIALSHTTLRKGERATGSAGKISFSRIAAEHWMWSVSTDFTSRKYNINDVGFFFSPNDLGGVAAIKYKEDEPGVLFRNYSGQVSYHQRHIFEGENITRQVTVKGSGLLNNYWLIDAELERDFGLYDHRETRGNGLYLKPSRNKAKLEIETDERQAIVVDITQSLATDKKHSTTISSGVGVGIKPFTWMDWEFQTEYQRERNREAWTENLGASSIFADRSTDRFDFTLRTSLTFTRELSLQLYSQLFTAKGHYVNYRQLIGTDSFIPAVGSFSHDFNEQSFNMNFVLRWEYLPGSTLYLVWSQARGNEDEEYFTSFGSEFKEAFRTKPSNVILLKLSYWMSL